MSDWPMFYTVLFFLAIGSSVAALIALPIVYRRGMRQIDAATSQVFAERDRQLSVSNVRTLSRWELARRMERKAR